VEKATIRNEETMQERTTNNDIGSKRKNYNTNSGIFTNIETNNKINNELREEWNNYVM